MEEADDRGKPPTLVVENVEVAALARNRALEGPFAKRTCVNTHSHIRARTHIHTQADRCSK